MRGQEEWRAALEDIDGVGIESVEILSYKKASVYLDGARDGVVVITLKKKVMRSWRKKMKQKRRNGM